MRLFVCLCRGSRHGTHDGAFPPHVLATTGDPVLVRQIVAGLRLNWLLENDAHDVIIERGLLDRAEDEMAALTKKIREAAVRLNPESIDPDA